MINLITIIFIYGLILTVSSVGYLAFCFIKVIFGKGGRIYLGLANTVLFIGLILVSLTWLLINGEHPYYIDQITPVPVFD